MYCRIIFYLMFVLIFFPLVKNNYANVNNGNNFFKNNQCINCHIKNDILPKDFNVDDIHFQAGIICADCHGGNPIEAAKNSSMNERAGFIGSPRKFSVPNICGKCHSNIELMKNRNSIMRTDQVEKYFKSEHGLQLKAGNKDVAICTSCHTAHNILPSDDQRSKTYKHNIGETCNNCHGNVELMNSYNIDSSIYEDYRNSVHGIALLKYGNDNAPTCNNCHGDHGAMMPGKSSISEICGNCHNEVEAYFLKSVMGITINKSEFRGCIECHTSHNIKKTSDSLLGVSEKSICIHCHIKGDKGYKEASKIHLKLSNFGNVYSSASKIFNDIKIKKINNDSIIVLLKDSEQSLIHSRKVIHTFKVQNVREKANEGIQSARAAISISNKELSDFEFRRNIIVLIILIISVVLMSLYLHFRKIDNSI